MYTKHWMTIAVLTIYRRLGQGMVQLEGNYHRTQRQVGRYQWYHEDVYLQAGRFNQNRVNIMTELQKVNTECD